MSILKYKGTVIPEVELDKLTTGEADAIERVIGMTIAKLNRVRQRCVCDHQVKLHQHLNVEGEVDESDSSCGVGDCDCDEFESDVSTLVGAALTWVAIKRVLPTTTFAELQASTGDEFEVLDDKEPDPDPTEPPPEAA